MRTYEIKNGEKSLMFKGSKQSAFDEAYKIAKNTKEPTQVLNSKGVEICFYTFSLSGKLIGMWK